MKKLFLLFVACFISQVTLAQESLELGVILGSPTGASAKVHLGNNRSIDAALAHSLVDDLGLEFHADYLFEKAYAFNIGAPSTLDLYYGIGGRIALVDKGKHDDDVAIGPRAPVGVSYFFGTPRLLVFAELAPVLNIVPDTDVDIDAGIGVRYRF